MSPMAGTATVGRFGRHRFRCGRGERNRQVVTGKKIVAHLPSLSHVACAPPEGTKQHEASKTNLNHTSPGATMRHTGCGRKTPFQSGHGGPACAYQGCVPVRPFLPVLHHPLCNCCVRTRYRTAIPHIILSCGRLNCPLRAAASMITSRRRFRLDKESLNGRRLADNYEDNKTSLYLSLLPSGDCGHARFRRRTHSVHHGQQDSCNHRDMRDHRAELICAVTGSLCGRGADSPRGPGRRPRWRRCPRAPRRRG